MVCATLEQLWEAQRSSREDAAAAQQQQQQQHPDDYSLPAGLYDEGHRWPPDTHAILHVLRVNLLRPFSDATASSTNPTPALARGSGGQRVRKEGHEGARGMGLVFRPILSNK